MKKTLIALFVAAAAATGFAGLLASEGRGERNSDDRHERLEQDARYRRDSIGGTGYLGDPAHARYQQECGDCHMAYPPALLPAASWQGVMQSLAHHFGDNAELDTATATEIAAFLQRHSAGHDPSEYSARTYRATEGEKPLRITETDYFIGQHHEIPRKMVVDNPGIKSFSRCEACHARAGDGLFDEHAVRIPGHGRWDD